MRILCSNGSNRPGSASMLIVTMMFIFVITTAITVDYAYMQLVRTELRSACDAAAKAGAEALSRSHSADIARQEAIRYAAANTVAGNPLRLNAQDIVVGRVTPSTSGKWNFRAGETPSNAVRIDAKTGSGSDTPIPLFFSRALGSSSFSTTFQATASQQECEVCLSLDRSGSMNWDMSYSRFGRIPPGNPTPWRPHPTLSRWAALMRALDVYLDTSNRSSAPPRTALVTWSSDTLVELPLPSAFSNEATTNLSNLRARARARGDAGIGGATNLSGGLDEAVRTLQAPSNNPSATKVVVLLTDGEWNEGRHPVNAAYDARAAGITVHCISMVTQLQNDLQKVADITGGRYYSTSNETELKQAFQEIARSLPVVLTD